MNRSSGRPRPAQDCELDVNRTPAIHPAIISTCPTLWRGNVAAFSHLESLCGIRYVPLEMIRDQPERFGKATIVMGGGFHPLYDWIIDNWSGEKWFRFDSPPTQMELSMTGEVGLANATVGVELQQLMKLKRLAAEGRIRLFVPSRKAADVLDGVAEYWPNVIDETLVPAPEVVKIEGTCGLFCEYYPRKNVATQMFAAKRLGAELWCGKRLPALYRELAADFEIPLRLVEVPDQRKYWSTLASLELSLQVTVTEALNYAVVEALLVGTPPLVSTSVPLVGLNAEFDGLCAVPVVDDPAEIAQTGERLRRDAGAYRAALQAGRDAVRQFAADTLGVARKLLTDLTGQGKAAAS